MSIAAAEGAYADYTQAWLSVLAAPQAAAAQTLAKWAVDPQLSRDQETLGELLASNTAYEGSPPTSHVSVASVPRTVPGASGDIDLSDCTSGNATFQTYNLPVGKDRTIRPLGVDTQLLTVVLVDDPDGWKVSYAADATGIGCQP